MIKKTALIKFEGEKEAVLIPYIQEDNVLQLFPPKEADSDEVMAVTLTEDEWEPES